MASLYGLMGFLLLAPSGWLLRLIPIVRKTEVPAPRGGPLFRRKVSYAEANISYRPFALPGIDPRFVRGALTNAPSCLLGKSQLGGGLKELSTHS